MAETGQVACASCARVPSDSDVSEDLVLCKCKGRYYCNTACRKADADTHRADCRTIEYLAQPKDMTSAPDMIKPRDRASSEIASQKDVIYHLILRIHFAGQPRRARYIAPFVELAGLEQKIQETVLDFSTVIPSGAFLSEILNAPVNGLAGVEKVRIPFQGLEGSISFHIPFEKQDYIKHCYRSSSWNVEKLLYTVVIDTLKIRTDKHEKTEQYVSRVEVEAIYASLAAASASVKVIVDRWNKEKVDYEGKLIPVEPNSVRGVLIDPYQKTELKHARIIVRSLWQAGVLKGVNGQAVMVGCPDRNGFAQRTRMIEHEEQEKDSSGMIGNADQSAPKKLQKDSMDAGADAEAPSKRRRVDEDEDQNVREMTIVATREHLSGPMKRVRLDEDATQGRNEDEVKY